MKKAISLISIALITGVMFTVFTPICDAINVKNNKTDIYRLHIIANSNSNEDQKVKLKVRDAILKYEKILFKDGVATKESAKALLMENASNLQRIAEQTLIENGFSYSVKLSTGIYEFPDRTYGEDFYPAGEYDALRIVLGDGKGENWWCVMFPQLCIIDSKPAKNADTEQNNQNVQFDSIFVKAYKWFTSLFN